MPEVKISISNAYFFAAGAMADFFNRIGRLQSVATGLNRPRADIQPGEKLEIDEYSMRVDGDYINIRRVILVVDGESCKYFVSTSQLAGYLTCEHLHGSHQLKSVKGVRGE